MEKEECGLAELSRGLTQMNSDCSEGKVEGSTSC